MTDLPLVKPHEDADYWNRVRREQALDATCPNCSGTLPPAPGGTGLPECECPRVTIYYLSRNGTARSERTIGNVTEVREGWDRRRGKLVAVRKGWHGAD